MRASPDKRQQQNLLVKVLIQLAVLPQASSPSAAGTVAAMLGKLTFRYNWMAEANHINASAYKEMRVMIVFLSVMRVQQWHTSHSVTGNTGPPAKCPASPIIVLL